MDNVVVLDCGSDTFKAGYTHSFPSEEEPRTVIPAAFQVVPDKDPANANTAESSRNSASLEGHATPIMQSGSISHWEGFEAVISSMLYDQLGWQREAEGGLLFAEPLFFSKVTGCVVDVGHTKTDISVVLEGQVSSPSMRRIDGGMAAVTRQLAQRLAAPSVPDAVSPSQTTLTQLMQACIRVAEDSAGSASEEAEQGPSSTTHTLPDGQSFTLEAGIGLKLGEAVLDPSLAGLEDGMPLPDAVVSSCACHLESATRKAALESLLVCGGGSGVSGLATRMLREVRGHLPASVTPQLLLPPDYMPSQTLRYATWMGGAVLAKVVFQQLQQHITKYDYDEVGPMVVHRKCS